MEHMFTLPRYIHLSPFLFIILIGSASADTGIYQQAGIEKQISDKTINPIEQDKARRDAVLPETKSVRSEKQNLTREKITFPIEENCFNINEIKIIKDDSRFNTGEMSWIIQQARGKCLGIESVRLLARTLQNEIIRMGYITTRINLPEQDISEGKLNFEVLTGKVGDIKLEKGGANFINLKSTLPFSTGDILRLRALEQGSANLQRVPGSSVKIKLLPGENKGESDLYIQRKQDKYWQIGAWMNDAGSATSGRYQGGATLYLNNITSLSDILYFSYGRDIDFSRKAQGNTNRSVGYSVPWGFWWLDLYASQSSYQQYVQGDWASWMINNKNHYFSTQLNYLIFQTASQKYTFGLQVFNMGARYFFNEVELESMNKKNSGWKAILENQYKFDNTTINTSLSYQHKMPWFGSSNTPDRQIDLIDKQGRVVGIDIQSSTSFILKGRYFNYSPHFNLQLTSDRLSTLNRFAIGNRWTVRGFDGEVNLQQNQGWYWRNDLSWIIPGSAFQPYAGLDIGQGIGGGEPASYSGKMLIGSVVGLRGWQWNIGFDLFAGVPLAHPDGFHTDSLTLGFSLQWRY
ncbi:ShlB/FhaC/HecB family hemolysin secretion/activation protein [Erwinia tasmaniensis]|uniref:ShlB/FhaC/HecB family hemolysin secretion/activation protein n=1 Tax=Erwinia tasmaniensis TaxID=338565 RepID=UPI003A4DA7BA